MKRLSFFLICIFTQFSIIVSAAEHAKTDTKNILKDASSVVKLIFESSNNMQFLKGLDHYSDDKNAYYVSDGVISSLDQLKKAYAAVGPTVEVINNEILEWNSKVLSPELVSFTLPVKLTLKLQGKPEYTGQIIWSALLKKENNKWVVVQSHESWLNCAEAAKALSP